MVDFQIPDEALLYLRDLAEQDTDVQWQVGDLMVDVWDELRNAVDNPRTAHASMIRQFAKASGIAQSTLRERENVARFFDKWTRSDVLTYHQHRAIKSAGDDWRKWMVWALDTNASVDQIRRAIAEEQNPEPAWKKRLVQIDAITARLVVDKNAPDDVKDSAILMHKMVQDALGL